MIFFQGIFMYKVLAIFLVALWIICFIRKVNLFKVIVMSAMIIYLGNVISLTFFPIIKRMSVTGFRFPEYNYTPFKSISGILKAPSIRLIIKQILGNVALLFPLPIFIATLNKNIKYRTLFICGFITSILIESGQFILDGFFTEFSSRCTDIDDVLLNSLGVLLGILVYNLTKKYILKLEKTITEN